MLVQRRVTPAAIYAPVPALEHYTELQPEQLVPEASTLTMRLPHLHKVKAKSEIDTLLNVPSFTFIVT